MVCRLPLVLAAALCGLASAGQVDVLSDAVKVGGPRKESPVYTAFDDASWGIVDGNLSSILGDDKQKLYDQFMKECLAGPNDCKGENDSRMYQNAYQPSSMTNYTATGFKKVRAPPKLFALLKEFWDLNHDKARVEYNDETAYHNSWQVPTTILMTEDDRLIGGGWNLSAAVWNAARDVLEEWTGQKLAGSSVYGIRVYHNQSVLAPHVDRLPLLSSAIINVAQDVDEDWMLEVYGHDGKATNVTMTPGDMVLYESHSVIHGRPFPLNGKFYANIFVHFQTMGDMHSTDPLPEEGNLPPYVIPGSAWEEMYWDDFPRGWTLLTDVEEIIRRGDLYTLKYVAQRDSGVITEPTKACGLMEHAILNKHVDILGFLLVDLSFDVNMVCKTLTPLDVAKEHLSPKDATISFLKKMGGITYKELVKKSPNAIPKFDFRCDIIRSAVGRDNGEVIEFLVEEMAFDTDTICDSKTPLDMVLGAYGEGEAPDEDSDPVYAFLLSKDASEYAQLSEKNLPTSLISDNRCTVMKAAVPYNSYPVFDFLFDSLNYDMNMVCDGMTPLDMVNEHYDEDDGLVEYFTFYGGKTYSEIADQWQEKIISFERCKTIAQAIRSDNIPAVAFLMNDMLYDAKMTCEGSATLLDIATETGSTSMIAYFSGKRPWGAESMGGDEL